jgi:hypothetical protein
VIHSIAGQNERWARLDASQSPPTAQSGQNGGSGFGNVGTTAAGASVVNPIGGDTAQPLSGNMNLMLMMFGGGSGAANGTNASSGTDSATQTAGAPDDTSAASAAQSGPGMASLLADLQSLLSSLGGNATSPTDANASGTTGTSGAPPSIGTQPTGTQPTGTQPTGTSSTGASSTGNSLLQDLDSIASDLGTIVASAGGAPPPSGGPASRWPGRDHADDISNPGTASAEPWRNGWDATTGGGWQQQYGLAAYTSGELSGTTGATASALQNITV